MISWQPIPLLIKYVRSCAEKPLTIYAGGGSGEKLCSCSSQGGEPFFILSPVLEWALCAVDCFLSQICLYLHLCNWLLAPPCSAACSCRNSSYSPLKQLLVLGSAVIRGVLLAGSAASVVVVCSDDSSFFSTSWVSALLASLLLSALVKYLQ